MEILIISGLSGAGKSSAATYLEDMGYYTVDNVPADIILKFAEFCSQSDGRYDRVALVSDIRSGDSSFQGLLDAMERLRQGGDLCRLLFVTSDLETIIKRYKETRRRHPLMADGMTIEQAMHREQELLRPALFNMPHAADIVRAVAAGRSGMRISSATTEMMLSYGVLRTAPLHSADDDEAVTISLDGYTDITAPIAISVSTEHVAAFDANGLDDNTLVLDSAALAGNPTWQLRHPRRGDKRRPYGMRQQRLLSEIFKKRHIAADKRASVWLLTRNDVIIWAIGVRTSAEFNIKTNKINQLFIKLQAK